MDLQQRNSDEIRPGVTLFHLKLLRRLKHIKYKSNDDSIQLLFKICLLYENVKGYIKNKICSSYDYMPGYTSCF